MGIPLFDRIPALEEVIPFKCLGTFPTPISQLEKFAEGFDIGSLYLKRDDQSGVLYGGNKVRKLEFILADAISQGAKRLGTFGCAGSNHALATAIYGHHLDLEALQFLLPQPNTHSVRMNLLWGCHVGASQHYFQDDKQMSRTVRHMQDECVRETGAPFYIIPPGGTSASGTLGFINAALELKAQIERAEMPEPDLLYVASGTMGTCAGLYIGLKIAGLKTRLVPVRVVDRRFTNLNKLSQLMTDCIKLLNSGSVESRFKVPPPPPPFFRHDHFGRAYGMYTEASAAAIKNLYQSEGIRLEGTYTGKTLAALVADAKKGLLADKTVLFWNTYNSVPYPPELSRMDYHKLPKGFYSYFETPVHKLDRAF